METFDNIKNEFDIEIEPTPPVVEDTGTYHETVENPFEKLDGGEQQAPTQAAPDQVLQDSKPQPTSGEIIPLGEMVQPISEVIVQPEAEITEEISQDLEKLLLDARENASTDNTPLPTPITEAPPPPRPRVTVVTGGSGGIGKATVSRFISLGDIVYSLDIVNPEDELIRFIQTDVTKPEQVAEAVKTIFEQHGFVDVLVNLAGVGISGSAEGTTFEDGHRAFDVNFHGMANMCSRVIPIMREQKSGKIINIASMAAIFPLPFQSFYSASKAAVLNFGSGLRTELAPFGIHVSTALFDEINSGFSNTRIKNIHDDQAYKYHLAKSVAKYEFKEQKGKPTKWVAKRIVALSQKEKPRTVAIFGMMNRIRHFLARFLPENAKIKIMAKKY